MKRSDKSLPADRIRELKRIAEKIDRDEAERIKATGRAVKAKRAAQRAAPPAPSDRSESGGAAL